MMTKSLLKFKANSFSQNGEDGVIQKIFEVIGTTTKRCCEFGAWDGIHLSNTKALIDSGWEAVLIEGCPEKHKTLIENFKHNPKVLGLNRMVNDSDSTLDEIFASVNASADLDFLSIDIDGLDYYIFEKLKMKPRLICVEVNAGHSPEAKGVYSRVEAEAIGQPMTAFCQVAQKNGYRLICYTGNAFFLRQDVKFEDQLPELTTVEAYKDFLNHLTITEKSWLWGVNLGILPPYKKENNPYLTKWSSPCQTGPSSRPLIHA